MQVGGIGNDAIGDCTGDEDRITWTTGNCCVVDGGDHLRSPPVRRGEDGRTSMVDDISSFRTRSVASGDLSGRRTTGERRRAAMGVAGRSRTTGQTVSGLGGRFRFWCPGRQW